MGGFCRDQLGKQIFAHQWHLVLSVCLCKVLACLWVYLVQDQEYHRQQVCQGQSMLPLQLFYGLQHIWSQFPSILDQYLQIQRRLLNHILLPSFFHLIPRDPTMSSKLSDQNYYVFHSPNNPLFKPMSTINKTFVRYFSLDFWCLTIEPVSNIKSCGELLLPTKSFVVICKLK